MEGLSSRCFVGLAVVPLQGERSDHVSRFEALLPGLRNVGNRMAQVVVVNYVMGNNGPLMPIGEATSSATKILEPVLTGNARAVLKPCFHPPVTVVTPYLYSDAFADGEGSCVEGLLRWPTLGAEYITLTTVEVIPSQWANTSKSRLPVICGGLSAPVSSARTSPPVTAMFAVSSLPLRCSQLGDINLKESEKGPEVGRSAVFGETQEHLFVEAETVPSQRTEVTPQRICRQGGPTEALYHGPRGLPHDDSKNFYSPYNYGSRCFFDTAGICVCLKNMPATEDLYRFCGNAGVVSREERNVILSTNRNYTYVVINTKELLNLPRLHLHCTED
uniref:Uncharacterized protein n=1 Tax=Vespula pensylvanica TaxID=30213 RepID=A0A834JRY9_VESPE|nr:hypothetical protein H0235_017321 [Vespula pensylvanica]